MAFQTFCTTPKMPLKTVCVTLKSSWNTLIAMSSMGEMTDHAEESTLAISGAACPMICCIHPILLPTNSSTVPTFWPMPSKMVWNTGARADMTCPMPSTSPPMTGAAALMIEPICVTTVSSTGSTAGITDCTVSIMLAMTGMTAVPTCWMAPMTAPPKLIMDGIRVWKPPAMLAMTGSTVSKALTSVGMAAAAKSMAPPMPLMTASPKETR